MSVLLILAIVFILIMLVVFALLLAGYWETPEQIKEQVMALVRRKSDPPTAFRNWVESSLGDNPQLQTWLLSLSDEGFSALTQRVVAFCADLNIQLSWLAERHLEVAPELHKAVKTIVVDYLEVCCEAIRHQDQIALFSKYHKLVTNPTDARYRDIRRSLYIHLAAEGLAEPFPSYEMIMASETQRQTMAANAIRNVAAKDWTALARIFGEILAGNTEKTESATAAKSGN
ncbi:MAG: hypothetical protein PHE55_01345 [Methylococcaceae bacterium]|nr:hypothetical protein [Methylococcaceae bacterium]